MTTEEQVKYLKNEIKSKNKIIAELVKFYNAVNNALAEEKQGHDGWAKVQEIMDKIEDDWGMGWVETN